ncbi:unnamed protein product, partial [Mesorhabditis belari]|uniref:Uncharacterized protein n=1 Tax=Mesorhabditis belari TaxID=2138241 RepID=A0AAF3F2E3_9BILA
MIVGWNYENAFFYLPGLSFCVISAAIIGLADPLFISEISPIQHKGFYTATTLAFAGVFNGICLVLAREDLWGTPQKWGYIAILAQCVNIFVPISGLFLPDQSADSQGYLNVLCYRILEGSGFPALTYVVATEILPKQFVVTGGQFAMMGSSLFIGLIATLTPLASLEKKPLLLSEEEPPDYSTI